MKELFNRIREKVYEAEEKRRRYDDIIVIGVSHDLYNKLIEYRDKHNITIIHKTDIIEEIKFMGNQVVIIPGKDKIKVKIDNPKNYR
ncbi:hypothetical protein [Halocella sp. SP3-1]|uniref:hypothetical protein n=1 Tax=Halocella sp. SP3-1 TaxID=2382161 RepID=UPI000F75090F|nr:hypothetical protein [Halocella sp. SP3-1]AZO95265.1 hypothetical protein D7D81_12060 [Halocella sp. SP3-1]